jgi:beta-xylosidase
MAHASAPEGPYVDQGPLVCDRDGSIDATQYNDDRGRPFLIWKEDGNSAHSPSRIWVRRMRADGTGLIGPRHELLRNQDRWEGGVVEAPHVVAHDGWLYLFYSGNTYGQRSCHYAVGVARARTLLGPWQRAPRNPIVHSNGEWRCPGHSSSVDDGMGNQYLLYHGYRATDRRRTQRVGLLDRITWTASGWPQINGGRGPSGSSTTVAPPAPPAAPAPPATAAPAAG